MKTRTTLPLALLLLTLLGGCTSGPQQGASQVSYGNDLAIALGASLQSLAVGNFSLHYAEAGEIGKPTVVFIHGTPGSWRALGRLLGHSELRSAARLVAIDRPGWGGSPLNDKEAEGSFAEQVKLIAPLLQQLKAESGNQPMILVGHSLGASYAPYIAYRHPELIDGILMAAGAIDPELGKPRWYNYAANVWPISRMIDVGLQKANVEIWGVHDALTELEPWWQQASIPMIYMQGEEDELVDPKNLDYAENSLPRELTRVVRIPNQSHFVHRQQEQLIAELTLELLAAASAN
ncbi:MAG: alpha/beta hydrolase [Pseudomonadales bacterium]|nr:alpha/beta hydrolase [Pseudomonadales bacterium]